METRQCLRAEAGLTSATGLPSMTWSMRSLETPGRVEMSGIEPPEVRPSILLPIGADVKHDQAVANLSKSDW